VLPERSAQTLSATRWTDLAPLPLWRGFLCAPRRTDTETNAPARHLSGGLLVLLGGGWPPPPPPSLGFLTGKPTIPLRRMPRRDFRHFVTAITGGGWVLCEVKVLSHGTKGQSNAYHRFGYCRRDRIRRLVGLYGCAVEGWEGGCACGVGSDLTACAYVALASRRNTGRILAT
jgi:hypothetical protein